MELASEDPSSRKLGSSGPYDLEVALDAAADLEGVGRIDRADSLSRIVDLRSSQHTVAVLIDHAAIL